MNVAAILQKIGTNKCFPLLIDVAFQWEVRALNPFR
jgi:hypothetical protein